MPSNGIKDALSPTQVEKWLKCPQLWEYEKTWEPRVATLEPYRAVGLAVAAGLEAHYLKLHDPDEAARVTLALNFDATEQWPMETLRKLVLKGIRLALDLEVCDPSQVVAVEQPIGHCRPDLIHQEQDGLVITDWKVRMSMDARYKDETLAKYNHSWQLLHYAWTVLTERKQPVARAQIGLIVLAPKGLSILHPVDVSLPRIYEWFESAMLVWKQMQVSGSWRNYTQCSQPYQCSFYEACHVYHGDPDRMEALYQRKGKEG